MNATAARSKDPNTKVGAVIVDPDNKIVGMGYNGFPPGVKDYEDRWSKVDPDGNKIKYKYVVHAEMNAIFNSQRSVQGCKVYVPFWPCSDCAKHMSAAGIKEIVIVDTEYYDSDLTREILIESEITVRSLEGKTILEPGMTFCMVCDIRSAAYQTSGGPYCFRCFPPNKRQT